MKLKYSYIFCLDSHRNFSEEVKRHYSGRAAFIVASYQTVSAIIDGLKKIKRKTGFVIVLLGLEDNETAGNQSEKLISEIRKARAGTGIILVCPPARIEEIKKNFKFNIEAYIPRNKNFMLRCANAVMKYDAEQALGFIRRRRNVWAAVLLLVLVSAIAGLLIVRFLFPDLFN